MASFTRNLVLLSLVFVALAGLVSAAGFYEIRLLFPANNTNMSEAISPWPQGQIDSNPAQRQALVTFNISIVGEADLNVSNATLLSNFTGAWTFNASNSTNLHYANGTLILNTTINFTSVNVTEGQYVWTVNVSNRTAVSLSNTSTNFTFFVDFTPPTLRRVTPLSNGSNTSFNYFLVNVSANDSLTNIHFCTITNTTGVNVTGNNTYQGDNATCEYNFTGLSDGWFKYTVWVNDTANNFNDSLSAWALTNNYFQVDTTKPTAIVANTTGGGWANNSNFSSNYTYVNFTITEKNPQGCTLQYNNGSGNANYTMTLSDASETAANRYCYMNATANFSAAALMVQTHNYTVYVNDSAGNTNASALQYATFDNLYPTHVGASAGTLPNNSNMSATDVVINYTFIESGTFGNCTLQWNNGTDKNVSMALSVNSTGGYCSYTVDEGLSSTATKANYTVFMSDGAANVNASTERSVSYDATAPASLALNTTGGSFANNTNYSGSSVIVNVTFTEANPNNCVLQFNNTNYTMTGSFAGVTAANRYCSLTVSTLENALHNYTVFVNDTSGNVVATGPYYVRLDTTYPTHLASSAGTWPNNSNSSADDFYVNYSFIEGTPKNCTLQFNNGTATNFSMALSVNSSGGFCSYTVDQGLSGASLTNYTVYVSDGAGNVNASALRTVNHDSNVPVSLALNTTGGSLANNSNYSGTSVVVNVTFAESYPNNCVLQFNNTNYTMTGSFAGVTAANRYCSLTVSTLEGVLHNYTVFVNDSAGNIVATGPYYVRLDIIYPTHVGFAGPTHSANNSNTSADFVYVNSTFIEGTPKNCTLQFNNGTATNYSMTLRVNDTGGYCFYNVSNAFNGSGQLANYTVYVSDGAGNVNASALKTVRFDNVTPSVPQLGSGSLQNLTNSTVNYLYVNVTFTEANANNCILEFNSTNYTMTGSFGGNTAANRYCTYNVTTLAAGLHNYTVYVNDTAGNVRANGSNFTQLVDLTYPAALARVSPTMANASNTTRSYLFVNWSFTEANPANCTLVVNGSVNYSMSLVSPNSSSPSCYYNLTTLGDGVHNWTAYVTDSTGKANASDVFFARVDTTSPRSVLYASPTLVNNSNTSQNSVYVNFTFNETTPSNCTLQFNNGSGNANYSMSITGSGTNGYCSLNVSSNFTAAGQVFNYTVFVADAAGNTNASPLHYVMLDNVTPSVSLSAPDAGVTLNAMPQFNFTYTDSLSMGHCFVYVDGVVVGSNSSVLSGVVTAVGASAVVNAPHTWFVNCLDTANNTVNSSSREFSLAPGGSVASPTPVPTPVPTVVPVASTTTASSISVPPAAPAAPTPEPVVVEVEQVSQSTAVEASFAETSATFVVTYTAPSSGFDGEITHRLPFDFADYEAGLITISPEPKSVAPGSIVATWDVALAPSESFEATVDVAKPVEKAVVKEFRAPVVKAKARPFVAPVAGVVPSVVASVVPVVVPASVDDTLWYAVGAVVLLGVLYFVFVGGRPKRKGL